MRKNRPRYPKQQEIMLVVRSLQASVPMDRPLEMGWRESEAKNPNLRVRTSTNVIDWNVDIYSGSYYVVRVDKGPGQSEVCQSIPSLIGYLCRMLEVRPLFRY